MEDDSVGYINVELTVRNLDRFGIESSVKKTFIFFLHHFFKERGTIENN